MEYKRNNIYERYTYQICADPAAKKIKITARNRNESPFHFISFQLFCFVLFCFVLLGLTTHRVQKPTPRPRRAPWTTEQSRMHFGKINELILARKTVSNFKNSHLSRDVTQGTNIVGMANSEARLPVTLFPRLKINITSEDELSSCEEFDHHHHYFQICFKSLMYSKYFVMHTKITLRLFNLFQMYIYRNNIYYAVNVKQALNKNEIQLTQDGNVGVYFNGIPDWLYEEEIFKSNNAVWWSPKGDYLCYASINDSKVQSMVYPIYGPFSDPNNLYPRLEALRYPKVSVYIKFEILRSALKHVRLEQIRENSKPTRMHFFIIHIINILKVAIFKTNKTNTQPLSTLVQSIGMRPSTTLNTSNPNQVERHQLERLDEGLPEWFHQDGAPAHLATVPGTKNPIIKLWVVDLKNNLKIPREIFPPSQIRNQEHYVTSVSWIDNTRLSVIWITRSQNLSVIGECILNKQQCFTVNPFRPTAEQKSTFSPHYHYPLIDLLGLTTVGLSARVYSNYYTDCISQRSKENAPGGPEGKAWVEMFDPPVHGAYKYYLRLPIANSRSGYFQHIAKLKFMENRKQFLTRGEYEVTKIISFDRETETLFYIANRVGKAGERHLYSVADHRFTNHHEPKCLTCDIGNECLYNDAKFSPNHKYYILECLGPGVPYSALYRIHNNTFVKLLDQNDEVRNFVAYRAMPQNRTFLVPLPSKFSNGCCPFISSSELFERLMPRSIPWLSRRYGGPGTQNVKEEFKVDWSTYLTTYWGWAYGGYVVTRAMTSPYGNSFQCGIAVAPVTSWLYQDSFYTERYMQTFEENRIGYLDADALLGAADLKDKKFLLIHGSADDHVHFQQSMMLAMALNSNGVMYRSQFYPDESHDLAGVKEHLYRTMGGFLDECFEQSEMDFYS
ncbi:Venom dipeptidyl peptidase 4 [Nymphon striatum]|nr:Venom dipeptidyl peptidase 4 [Nymphon striatum]